MTGTEPVWRHFNRRWLTAFIAATALSFAAKVVIAKNTYGSLDALIWETELTELRDHGALTLYRNGTTERLAGAGDRHMAFNRPPFLVHLLSCWGWLSDVSGLPLRFWLRMMCAVADLGSVFLLAGIMVRTHAGFRPATLFLAAASPVSLMISGFHCNVDPIMVAFLVLAIYLLETSHIPLAGIAMGMAINIKIVPLIFLPAIFFYLSGRKRIEFFSAAAGTFLLASLPIIVQDPLLVWNRVFAYNPESGIWGISRFVFVLASEPAFHTYARIGKIPLLVVLALISLWMNARELKPPLALQCGLITFLFLALTPGFGIQYLAWLVPWACFLTLRQSLVFHATASLYLFTYYNRGSNGFPWYMASWLRSALVADQKSAWYASLMFVGLLSWFTISCLAAYSARRLSKDLHLRAGIAG